MSNLSRQEILDIAHARQQDALEMAALKRHARDGKVDGTSLHHMAARRPPEDGSTSVGSSSRLSTSIDDFFVEDSAPSPLAAERDASTTDAPVPNGPSVSVLVPPTSLEAATAQPPTRSSKLRKPVIVAISAIAFISVALAVVIPVVILTGGDDDGASSQDIILGASFSSSSSDPGPDIWLVPGLANETKDAIEGDLFSPQAMAYEWVEKDPKRLDYPEWRIQQRFAMAVYTFAKVGKRFHHLSYIVHECKWVRTAYPCSPDGHFLLLEDDGGAFQQNKGALPRELLLLRHLEILDMSGTGQGSSLVALCPYPLPPTLKEFHCNNCELVGTIPANFFLDRGMNNLTKVALANNKLQGSIPAALVSNLQHSLESLALAHNRLTSSIPSELGLVSPLRELFLGDNMLNGSVPKELAALASLTSLDVVDNENLEPTFPEDLCSSSSQAEEGIIPLSFLRTDWCQDLPAKCRPDAARPTCCEHQQDQSEQQESVFCDPDNTLTNAPDISTRLFGHLR